MRVVIGGLSVAGAVRRAIAVGVASAAAMLALLAVAATPALASGIPLSLPGSTAFAVLGHSCGGIGQNDFATGFDPTTGYPAGDVALSTGCSTGGRGSRTAYFCAWVGVTWDFTGAMVRDSVISSSHGTTPCPATGGVVNPTLVDYDTDANEVYNQSNRAYLVTAPGYVPVPRLFSISASQGPTSGGTSVTITGDGFTAVTAVDFGSSPATSFTVNNDSSITAAEPAGAAGTIDLTVTSAGGTSATSASDQFTFVPAPTLMGLSPASAVLPGGVWITVTGTNLATVTGVTFGGQPTPYQPIDDTSISAYVPVNDSNEPGPLPVSVTTVGGTTPASTADIFTYVPLPPPPAVTGASPNAGPAAGGGNVTITGSGFAAATGVEFGSTPAAFTVNSDTSITAVAPARDPALGPVDLTVYAAGGGSGAVAADTYTYQDPVVSALGPALGPTAGGNTVAITGSGFTGATGVFFGSTATSFAVNSDTSISAVAPAENPGVVDVTVVFDNGTVWAASNTTAADQYRFGDPPAGATGPVSTTTSGPGPSSSANPTGPSISSARPATCTVTSIARRARTHTGGHGAFGSSGVSGGLPVSVRCDLSAAIRTRATVRDTIAAGPRRQARTRSYRLATVSASVQAGAASTLKLALPAPVVSDLLRGARQYLTLTVIATNESGTSRAAATIGPLTR